MTIENGTEHELGDSEHPLNDDCQKLKRQKKTKKTFTLDKYFLAKRYGLAEFYHLSQG